MDQLAMILGIALILVLLALYGGLSTTAWVLFLVLVAVFFLVVNARMRR